MNRFAALIATSFLASLVALGAEVGTPLPQAQASWASEENDLGEVEPGLRLTHLTMVLNRPAERQRAFETLLREQQDPRSRNFHRWLTPEEIGQEFGPADQDIAAVSSWLESQGLHVDAIASSRVRIEFSGQGSNVSAAFGASLHTFAVDGEKRVATVGTPRVPVSLATIVRSVIGLQTVHERANHSSTVAHVQVAAGEQPNVTSCSGGNCNHYIGPADFATIYDVNPSYQQGINGAGQTIAIVGRSRVYPPDIENFQMVTGSAIKAPVTIIPPNGVDPGPPASSNDGTTHVDQSEATLDVTRAGSVAPGATIDLVISANPPSGSGVRIASQHVVNTNLAQIMNISFSSCEQSGGLAVVSFWDSLFSQAAAQGISVFVSSGDSGAAECDKSFEAPPADQVASTNAICSSSYVTCVGGTEFADRANPDAYWSASNATGLRSAFGYIPEGAWNDPLDSTGNPVVVASGGGVSAFIATPSWQTGPGVPGVQGRYIPDVSFSSSAHDGYFKCLAASGGGCALDSNGAFRFTVASGTSAAAPSMAGIAALLNQKMNAAQGHLSPRLYELAANPGNGVFHDVTVATSGVGNCDPSIPSMCNNSTPGPTGLTGGLAGYTVGAGYDMVTGLGSIDVAKLLANWTSSDMPQGQLQMPSSFAFSNQVAGTRSAPTTLTITNIGGFPVTISSVTGSDNTDFPATTTCKTTLQPGGQCIITLSFAPSVAGSFSDIVTVNSNGVGSPQSFTVSGTGLATPGQLQLPSSFVFSNQTVGARSAPVNLTVTNTGGSPVTISSVTGSDNTDFPATTTCVTTLPASGQCGITLSFAPTAAGSFSDVLTVTSNGVGSPQSFTVSGTGFAAGTLSYEGLWLNGNESGWGLNLTHQGTILFATWFTYDSDGSGMWLVASNVSQTSAGNFTGALYRTVGPAFSAVPFTSIAAPANYTEVGTITLSFTDANSGTMSYTVNGVTQSKAITRFIYAVGGTNCTLGGSQGASPNYQDLWLHAPLGTEGGWGVNITHQGDILFATWFTYLPGGTQTNKGLWLVMSNGSKGPTGGYSGALQTTTGPAFNAVPFNPNNVTRTTVGTASFVFSDANNGTFSYTVNGVSQSKAITRYIYSTPTTVCQ